MSRRLVVVADRTGLFGTEAITRSIREAEVAWWHWLRPIWLVVDDEERELGWWRDRLKSAASGAHILVLDAEGSGSWAMHGQSDAFEWLSETWKG